MTCPVCGGNTKVTNSRRNENTVVRERTCIECGKKFYTQEVEISCTLFADINNEYQKNYRDEKKCK